MKNPFCTFASLRLCVNYFTPWRFCEKNHTQRIPLSHCTQIIQHSTFNIQHNSKLIQHLTKLITHSKFNPTQTISIKFFSALLNKIIPTNIRTNIHAKEYKILYTENSPIPNNAYLKHSTGATSGLRSR